MGDLACITYEDLIYHRSFDRELIRKRMDKVDLRYSC